MINILKTRILKGIVTRRIDSGLSKKAKSFGNDLSRIIKKRYGRSLYIRQVDTGSCGACLSEIISANNPLYDLQRFGVNFVASPRHADALLITGPVPKNMLTALKKTYDATPGPKFVITLGDCALDGGVFRESYYGAKGTKDILPVVLHIPGCPPSPITIVQSLIDFLNN